MLSRKSMQALELWQKKSCLLLGLWWPLGENTRKRHGVLLCMCM